MTQEEKDLLLKDICERLPHRPKIWFAESNSNDHLQSIWYDNLEGWQVDGDNLSAPVYAVKPYLYPIASMTLEQKSELSRFCDCPIYVSNWNFRFPDYIHNTMNSWEKAFTWLNKHHFDYRGLIKQGLAIDATGLNIY